MATIGMKFDDNSRFSVLGPDWSMRLDTWDKVPVGQLTLDGSIDNRPVRFRCRMDQDGTLYFNGDWERAEREARNSGN